MDVWYEEYERQLGLAETALARCERINAALKRRDRFTIALCGRFSTGKTSLINALLGLHLPTGINPITKAITSIEYGRNLTAALYNPSTRRYMPITIEDAERRILHPEAQGNRPAMELHFTAPSPLLKSGLRFVDTPGLQDCEGDAQLDELTRAAIQDADFCIVTFACNSFADFKERQFLDELQAMTGGNFLCVLNCLNYVSDGASLELLRQRARNLLQDYGNERVGRGRHFFVNSTPKDTCLDGLDDWLRTALTRKMRARLRSTTAAAKALNELRRVIPSVDECVDGLGTQVTELSEQNLRALSDALRRLERGDAPELRKLQRIREQRSVYFDTQFLEPVMEQLRNLPPETFNDCASNAVRKAIRRDGKSIDDQMRGTFRRVELPSCCGFLREAAVRIEQRRLISTRKTLTEYLVEGVGGGQWGWERSYWNKYLEETERKLYSETIPDIQQHLKAYFDLAEERIHAALADKLSGGCEEEIRMLQGSMFQLYERQKALLNWEERFQNLASA